MAQKHVHAYARVINRKRPGAFTKIEGSPDYPQLRGMAKFYQLREGVLVTAEVAGLSLDAGDGCNTFHGFHIHDGSSCTGTMEDPFADALGHYNPLHCPHPDHAGDLVPLLATKSGEAWLAFLSDRFVLQEIIGKTVIIHRNPDDFTSQPSGNAGTMIACGVIQRVR